MWPFLVKIATFMTLQIHSNQNKNKMLQIKVGWIYILVNLSQICFLTCPVLQSFQWTQIFIDISWKVFLWCLNSYLLSIHDSKMLTIEIPLLTSSPAIFKWFLHCKWKLFVVYVASLWLMRDDGGVTSVNVVSAVSLKTRVIGAEMEHPGASHDIAIRGLLFVSELVNYKTT